MEDLLDIMEKVEATLEKSTEFGLQTEVIASAMQFLKNNPDATVEDALAEGELDWDV